MEPSEALRQVLFLKTADEEAISELMASGQALRLAKGEALFAEFGRCRGLFVVLTGAIKVYKVDSRGRATFRLEETNEAIGGHLGTVREVVSRTLRTLKEAKVVGLRGRWVDVPDVEELKRIAGADQ